MGNGEWKNLGSKFLHKVIILKSIVANLRYAITTNCVVVSTRNISKSLKSKVL